MLFFYKKLANKPRPSAALPLSTYVRVCEKSNTETGDSIGGGDGVDGSENNDIEEEEGGT